MDTTDDRLGDGRRRRRRHSAEFKADAVAACRQAGVSIAAVALSRGLNANLLRRWVADGERLRAGPAGEELAALRFSPSSAPAAAAAFVPVSLPAPVEPVADIRLHIRRGPTTVEVNWPMAAAAECARWMRELLR